MGRHPSCSSDEAAAAAASGLKKGPWTPEEDHKLAHYIQQHGHGNWRSLPKLAGLNRCGKSCRLRWTNYLRPDIRRGKFSSEEEDTILRLHSILGNKWSAIAKELPGRTDNEVKNYWNTHLKKRLIKMGFDPTTHRPRTDFVDALPQILALVNLRQQLVDQTQAEVVQAAKLQYLQQLLQTAAAIAAATNSLDICPAAGLFGLTATGSSINVVNNDPITESIFHPPETSYDAGHLHQSINYENRNISNNANTPTTLPAPQCSNSLQLPPLTDTVLSHTGDYSKFDGSCASSSSPFPWHDLILDDDGQLINWM